jgi:hypothetical protein
MDPMGYDAGDMNLYGFVAEDPINAADPSGLQINPAPTFPRAFGGGVDTWNFGVRQKLRFPELARQDDIAISGGAVAVGALIYASGPIVFVIGGIAIVSGASGHDNGEVETALGGAAAGRLVIRGFCKVLSLFKPPAATQPPPGGVRGAAPGAPALPQTIREVDLPGRIRQAGHTDLKRVGEFFGWEPRQVTKTAADFTKDQLLANGWTKERLLNVAEGYEHITRVTPSNPSAAGRAAQLRDLAKLFD